jgi:HAD superfamily hydrolase (TIGR01549 family)
MTAYDSLILDHDGVLVTIVDSNQRLDPFQTLASREFRDRGIPPESVSLSTLAHSVTPDTVETMSEQLEVTPETLWRARDDVLATVLQDAATEGSKRPYSDIEALSETEVPLGVASNNQRRVVEFVLDEYDLTNLFETVHARESTLASLSRKKPSPTFLEAAQTEMAVSNPLYVGDKESDVLAARRAGMDSVFLRRSHNESRELDCDPTYDVETLTAVVDLVER